MAVALPYNRLVHLTLPDQRRILVDRPVIVGILNVTPDSFADGGLHLDADAAVLHARRMAAQGADLIDVGGESTRPGATRIDATEQRRRVIPVIERLIEAVPVPLSIDTTRREVAEAALDAGAAIINDVSAGRDDPSILSLAAERGAPFIAMHMRGQPADMQHDPRYDDVVGEVLAFLKRRVDAAVTAGLPRSQIVIDPGIGFGKTTTHNLRILAALDRLVATGQPVMLGVSRKRFLGELTGAAEPADRVWATAAVTALAVAAGVMIHRVHDVLPARHAADVTFAACRHRS